jgi:hypothetical protein
MSRKISSRHSGVRCSTNRQRLVAIGAGRFSTLQILRRAGSALVEFLRSVTDLDRTVKFRNELRANVFAQSRVGASNYVRLEMRGTG